LAATQTSGAETATSVAESYTPTDTPTSTLTPTVTPSPVPQVGITVQIFSSSGEMVYSGPKTLMFSNAMTGVQVANPAFAPGDGATDSFQMAGAGGTFEWNGLNANGQSVAAGVYTVSFVETGVSIPRDFSAEVTVLSSQSTASVSIYNSAGELVQYFPLPTDSASDLNLSSNSFVPGAGKPGLTITWGPEPGESVQWSGLNSSGVQVASGIYRVELDSQSPGAALVTLKAFVQVFDPATDLLGGVVVAPNPMVGGRTLYFYAPGLEASDSLKLGFYDLAGHLVVQAYGQGPKQQLTVPNDVSGGVYLAVLEAQSAETGAFERRVFKVALVR